jgi:hypothetical protein
LPKRRLFSDAECAEDGVEQILCGRSPDNFADGIGTDAQIDSNQVKRRAGPELLVGRLE